MYVCMYACRYVCVYVRMYVCMYVCMYACMYVCMYVCTYPHRLVGTSVCLHTSTVGTFDIVGTFLESPQINCLQTLRFVEKRLFQGKMWRSPQLAQECKFFQEGPHNVKRECKKNFINCLRQSYNVTLQYL